MDCDGAIDQHLDENYRGRLETPSLEMAQAALCYANRGQLDRVLDLPNGPLTVAQVIKEFGLGPFAHLLDDKEPGRYQEVRYPAGTLVTFWKNTCRVIGRRQVTMLAMPRDDDFEVYLESLDGVPMYFVGESMVGPVEEGQE